MAASGGFALGKIALARADRFGHFLAVAQTFLGVRPRIKYEGPDPGEFDLVIAGTPVWAANFAAPLRSFFYEYGSRIKRVAFFCTYGGQGADRALERLQQTSEKLPLNTLHITDAEIESGGYQGQVTNFVEQIKRLMH